ncbi:MAG: hypothetical protein IPK90_08205 [Chitinophagaceae bacterium]|nr:hypothetical protein [Chitinophagaceae bacterium]
MKQSKFSLADVLTVLTALAFGFVCFLGKNFSTMGNTSLSITWAVIITVLLAGTAFIAKLLKRTSRNFKTNFILEIAVLLLFTGLMVFFAYLQFPHYFNVSAKKTDIQGKLQISITQAENMFADYEAYVKSRENTFKGSLGAAANLGNPGDLLKYDFKDKALVPYDKQIAHKISNLQTDLLPSHYSNTVNRNGIKEVATTWLAKARKTTTSWKPIGIVNVVNDVEKNSKDWLNQLIGFLKDVKRRTPYRFFRFSLSTNFSRHKSTFYYVW